MKISDVTCASCRASYEMAETISARGEPGEARCVSLDQLDISGLATGRVRAIAETASHD